MRSCLMSLTEAIRSALFLSIRHLTPRSRSRQWSLGSSTTAELWVLWSEKQSTSMSVHGTRVVSGVLFLTFIHENTYHRRYKSYNILHLTLTTRLQQWSAINGRCTLHADWAKDQAPLKVQQRAAKTCGCTWKYTMKERWTVKIFWTSICNMQYPLLRSRRICRWRRSFSTKQKALGLTAARTTEKQIPCGRWVV